MMDLRILTKTSFPEIPPRVEYKLTNFGKRFVKVKVLDSVRKLQGESDREIKCEAGRKEIPTLCRIRGAKDRDPRLFRKLGLRHSPPFA